MQKFFQYRAMRPCANISDIAMCRNSPHGVHGAAAAVGELWKLFSFKHVMVQA